MRKIISIIIFALLVLVFTGSLMYAASGKIENPSWFEHVDLMQILISCLFIIVAWFLIRTIKKIDANQTMLFAKYNEHEKRLSHLEGAHEVRTDMKLSCLVDK